MGPIMQQIHKHRVKNETTWTRMLQYGRGGGHESDAKRNDYKTKIKVK